MAFDPDTLPARMTTGEVCALARYGKETLARRIKAGTMPAPVDRARQMLFDRGQVLAALGIDAPAQRQEGSAWAFDPAAFKRARAKQSVLARKSRLSAKPTVTEAEIDEEIRKGEERAAKRAAARQAGERT